MPEKLAFEVMFNRSEGPSEGIYAVFRMQSKVKIS